MVRDANIIWSMSLSLLINKISILSILLFCNVYRSLSAILGTSYLSSLLNDTANLIAREEVGEFHHKILSLIPE